MGRTKRDASKIDISELCERYRSGQTVRELSDSYGFDPTTISNKLRTGLGADVYEKEVYRRQKLQYHYQEKPKLVDLSQIHWLARSHWGTPAADELNQLARELRQ